MRGFRFRLARLERLRDLTESTERAAYGQAQARCVEVEQAIAQAQRMRELALAAQRDGRRSPDFRAARELAQQTLVERLEDHLVALAARLAELEDEAERQREVWERARTEQRTLERLRERDLAVHLKELEAREREEQDEWASSRGARPSRESAVAPDASPDGPGGSRQRRRS
jgi:flagellar FliJ protein